MSMDAIEYRISGDDLQFVEIVLEPGHAAIAEPGAMMYMDDGVTMDTVLGDGSQSSYGFIGRLGKAIRRSFTGESLFSAVFSNDASQRRRVAFAAPYPGQIVPMDLAAVGGSLICQKGGFLCAARGVEIGLAWQKRLRVGFLGGEGFIMQKLTGDGTAFVHASGALTEMRLGPGETLRVDTGCLVALQPTVTYDIKYAGRLKTAVLGGEGLFFANLTGPGTIWLQSMPMRRLSRRLVGSSVGLPSRSWGARVYLLIVIIGILLAVFGRHAPP